MFLFCASPGRDDYLQAFSSVFFVAAGGSGPELSFEALSRAFQPWLSAAGTGAGFVAATPTGAATPQRPGGSQQVRARAQFACADVGRCFNVCVFCGQSQQPPQPQLDVSWLDAPAQRKSRALVRLPGAAPFDAAAVDRVVNHFAVSSDSVAVLAVLRLLMLFYRWLRID